jgi:hypothetical protein
MARSLSAAGHLIEYPVRVARFSALSSITLYIPDNFGDEATRISYIGFKGEWEKFNRYLFFV